MRLLLCGGGTAGHINPAVAVADYVKQQEKDCEILFVGTNEGMEKSLVPRNGYDIKFIKIHGFKRSLSPYNLKVVAELFKSINDSKKIIKEFTAVTLWKMFTAVMKNFMKIQHVLYPKGSINAI